MYLHLCQVRRVPSVRPMTQEIFPLLRPVLHIWLDRALSEIHHAGILAWSVVGGVHHPVVCVGLMCNGGPSVVPLLTQVQPPWQPQLQQH